MKVERKWRRAWRCDNPSFRKAACAAVRRTGSGRPYRSTRPGRLKFWRASVAAVAVMLALLSGTTAAPALPAGGQVAAGKGSVAQSGSTMNVKQDSGKLAINWQSFSIGVDEKVNFLQPSSGAIALNRVLGNDASRIYGRLTANGRVFLVNPNGVVFAPGSYVNAGGLVASSLAISDSDFLSGRYSFQGGSPAGPVVNQGTILTADGGYAALLGPQAVNEGIIVVPKGTVVLGAGAAATLDADGDGLVHVAVTQAALDAQAANKKLIQADGGTVIMTARTAAELTSSAVNNSGVVQAHALTEKNGVIRLDGGMGGTVLISGSLDAAGVQPGQAGGSVTIQGNKVGLLAGAVINVSGATGGGTVRLGGNKHGQGTEGKAAATYVDPAAFIQADALVAGNGGSVTVWSDQYTGFYGRISARGSGSAGSGGFVETSSRNNLQAFGRVDTGAANGRGGTWLMDPWDVTVSGAATGQGALNGGVPDVFIPAASGANVQAAAIEASLNGGTSVTVTTGNTGSEGGKLTVAANIAKTAGGDATLTLAAAGHIIVQSGVSIRSTAGKLHVNFNSDTDQNYDGYIQLQPGSSIATNGGNIALYGQNDPVNGFASSAASGDSGILLAGTALNSGGGDIVLRGQNTAGQGVTLNGASLSSYDGMVSIAGAGQNTAGQAGVVFQGTGNSITAGSGSITLTADSMSLAGAGVSGTSTLTIQPLTVSGSIGLGAGPGTLMLPGSLFSGGGRTFQDGFSQLIVGRSDGTGEIDVGGVSFNTPVTIRSPNNGSVYVKGMIGTSNHDLTLTAGTIQQTAGTVSAGAGAITYEADHMNITGGSIAGTGSLLLEPLHAGTGIVIGTGIASLSLTQAELNRIGSSFSGITVGRADGTGVINVNGIVSYQNPLTIRSPGGTIQLNAGSLTTGTNKSLTLSARTLAAAGGFSIQSGRGDITLEADAMTFNSGAHSLSGSGSLHLQPLAPGKNSGMDAGAGDLNLPADLFGRVLDTTFQNITVGRPDGTGWIKLAGAATVGNDLTLQAPGGAITVAGTLQMNGKKLTMTAQGAIDGSAGTFTGVDTLTAVSAEDAVKIGDITGAAQRNTIAKLGSITAAQGASVANHQALTLTDAVSGGNGNVIIRAQGGLTLAGGASVAGAGDVYLSTDGSGMFVNQAGSTAIAPGSGRWLVYSTDPRNDRKGGLTEEFRRYGYTYANQPPGAVLGLAIGGKGFLYSDAPILHLAGATRVYGDGNQTFVYSFNPADFMAGDSNATLGLNPAGANITTNVTAASSAGDYNSGLTYNGGMTTSQGYRIAAGAMVDLHILKRPLVVAAGDTSRMYGDSNPVFRGFHVVADGGAPAGDGVISRGLANGDLVGSVTNIMDPAAAMTAHATANVANGGRTYDIMPGNAQFAAGSANNYAIHYVPGVLTITPRPLYVSADSVTSHYGDNLPASFTGHADAGTNGSGSGLMNGDIFTAITVVMNPTLTNTSPAGSTAVLTAAGGKFTAGSAGDYDIRPYRTGTLTIDRRPVTVTANRQIKIYDKDPWTDSALTYSASTVNGDTLTGSLTWAHNENAGVYPIGQGSVTNANNPNYDITYAGADFTIQQRPVILTVDSGQTKMYGQADPVFTYSVRNTIPGDRLGITLDRSDKSQNVGSYAIDQYAIRNANYLVNPAGRQEFTITPATLVYHANPAVRDYGGPNPVLSGTVTGFTNADTPENATTGALAFTTPATPTSNAGRYSINGGGLTANYGNYVFEQAAGNARALTVRAVNSGIRAAVNDAQHAAGAPYFGASVRGAIAAAGSGITGGSSGVSVNLPPVNGSATGSPTPVPARSVGVTFSNGAGGKFIATETGGGITVTPLAGEARRQEEQSDISANDQAVNDILVFRVAGQNRMVSGTYTVTYGSGGIALRPARQTAGGAVDTQGTGVRTGEFRLDWAGGGFARFRLEFAGSALAIVPVDAGAVSLTGSDASIRLITGIGLLAAQKDRNVSMIHIKAVYIYSR